MKKQQLKGKLLQHIKDNYKKVTKEDYISFKNDNAIPSDMEFDAMFGGGYEYYHLGENKFMAVDVENNGVEHINTYYKNSGKQANSYHVNPSRWEVEMTNNDYMKALIDGIEFIKEQIKAESKH